MKKIIFLVLSCCFTVFSCSIDKGNPVEPQNIKHLWHLINVSGGFAGINEQFSLETIVWDFDESTSTLKVVNNNEDDTIEDGLASGSYNYSVSVDGDNSYLTVGSNELGSFVTNQNSLVINQNNTSNGTGADGFIYTFKSVVVVID